MDRSIREGLGDDLVRVVVLVVLVVVDSVVVELVVAVVVVGSVFDKIVVADGKLQIDAQGGSKTIENRVRNGV